MDGNSSSTLCGVELTSSQIADPYRKLSTQQTCAFLAQFDGDEYFLNIDADFEQLIPHVDVIISQPKTTEPSASATSEYASPKGEKAIKAAIVNSIPEKTRKQTDWWVRVWTEWALSRNTKLLPGEEPFSTTFCELTVSEMNFWLPRFVLEICKKNGEPYPPNFSLPDCLWFSASASRARTCQHQAL